MIYKIAIIGAGQLGSRHLQSIAMSNINISIEVVEPFKTARDIAKDRYQEVSSNINVQNINFFESIDSLSDELDFVVIATNSDVRSKVTKELLNNKIVKNLILEKVLFQNIDEYYEIDKLLLSTKTKCWVNHSRRMYPFYQDLKDKLSSATQINFSISGGDWGLACNGLHFLDLITFLSNTNDLSIETKFLDKKLKETKRKDFIELSGNLIGETSNCTFSINSFNVKSPMQFSITSDILNIIIDESQGWYKIKELSNKWNEKEKKEKIIYFQSELTNIIFEDLVINNKCLLPTYNESMKLHITFINEILSHINSFSDVKFKHCPIT